MSNDSFFAELQGEFIAEALFLLENYEEHMLGLESEENRPDHLTQIFRVAHSIKGGSSAVGFPDLGKFAHKVEDLLAILRVSPEYTNSQIISLLLKAGDEFKKRLRQLQESPESTWNPEELMNEVLKWTLKLGGSGDKPKQPENVLPLDIDEINLQLAAETADPLPMDEPSVSSKTVTAGPKKGSSGNSAPTSIKVDLARVDSVLDAVGEIVVLKNQLVHDESFKNGMNPRLASVVDQLDKSVRELYEKTLGIRMTPLKSLFLKIQRIVRDVSLQLDKPVELQLLGEETEVERTVFEMLGDPMVHLVRNALDHGIENQETRKEKNKNLTASVTVSAKQSGAHVIIEIQDDGGGIHRDRILKKAFEKGLLPATTDPDSLTDQQVFQLLFAPGFSTAEKVTDLSGRGVGLDVVKSNLEKVHGKIEIESHLGKGSIFRLVIPLTTAITDGIVVSMTGHQYIIPTYSIKEIIQVSPDSFTRLPDNSEVVKVRDILLGVINLGNFFVLDKVATKGSPSGRKSSDRMLVVIENSRGNVALPIDEVIGQTQAVVKPFDIGEKVPEISGAAVLGNGSTVLILDPQALVANTEVAA